MQDKTVLKPEWKKFSDLFTGAREWSNKTSRSQPPLVTFKSELYEKTNRRGRDKMHIGRYCPVSGKALYCLEITGITPQLEALLREKLVIIDNDETFFEIIVHGETALVMVNHNKIIGDCWLAEIETSSIPSLK